MPFSALNIIISCLWIFSALADYSYYCYFWQLKEYRRDRMSDFLNTKQGQKLMHSYLFLWRSIIAFSLFFWPINKIVFLKYFLATIFLFELIKNIILFIEERILRPKITVKALFIIFFSISIEIFILFLSKDWTMVFLLLMTRFFIISAIVALISIPTKLIKKQLINLAEKKLSKYPKLMVIGITGSYGKTTVKEFLSGVLENKYKVIKTPKNTNTDIGIAKFILKTDFSKADAFIVEVGAYKIGEIITVCKMVKPKVGILTAINEQHLSLFGSIKNTQKAKYELLFSLPEDGLAIINSDNKYCIEYINDLKSETKTFGMDTQNNPDCLITDVKINKQGEINCFLIIKNNDDKKVEEFNTKIIGEYNALNLAPVILAAVFLGMKLEEIKLAIKNLKMPRNLMQTYKYGKAVIIDDSYNSNPDGFKAALSAVLQYPYNWKRIIITRGMLELGEKSDLIHEKIGGEIAFYMDELIIISPDSDEALRRGIIDKYRTKVKSIYQPKKLLKYIKELKNENCIVLLENRIFSNVLEELKKEN